MALPDLAGRTAVITGASRGLGAGLARDFQARGLRLGLCSRTRPELPGTGEVLARCLDVRDEAAMEAFATEVAARFGGIDLWINNAGVLEPIGPLRAVSREAFEEHLQINLLGVFLGTRAFVRHLRSTGREGVLINISSGAAWHGYAGWSAYCASKAGVDRLTECVALEEAGTGLRAHAVAPGVIDTAMQEQIRASSTEAFPEVERFLRMKAEESFNTPAFVAEHLLRIAFDPGSRPEDVVVRLPAQKG